MLVFLDTKTVLRGKAERLQRGGRGDACMPSTSSAGRSGGEEALPVGHHRTQRLVKPTVSSHARVYIDGAISIGLKISWIGSTVPRISHTHRSDSCGQLVSPRRELNSPALVLKASSISRSRSSAGLGRGLALGLLAALSSGPEPSC